jgi:hypothetical protein
MHVLRVALALGSLICGCANVSAGDVVLPSDISVALTAVPSDNLQSGQRVNFTISVTNHGPEPVDRLAIASSPIYDELDVFTASSSGCDGDLILAVADLEDTFYFLYVYYAAFQELPLAVDETRSCYLSLDFTPWAPSIFPLTFDMSAFDDLDPSNNSATVFLRRPVAFAAPVPTLSPIWLGLLACLLMAITGILRTQSNARLGHSPIYVWRLRPKMMRA